MGIKLKNIPLPSKTEEQYREQVNKARSLFLKKQKDYGTSWRILRVSSLADQLYIKAKRIRSIEEKNTQKVTDNIDDEFTGIINYSVLALIQIELRDKEQLDLPFETVLQYYDRKLDEAKQLMEAKNHDYGEVWREMFVASFTDLILMKLLRIRQILENDGKTIVSEGLDANFLDIINYAIFALIKRKEENG